MAKKFNRRNNFKRKSTLPEHRINAFIKVPEIRLVGNNFKEISKVAGKELEPGVFPTAKALEYATKMEMDLVEISPKASPPVCKIIEYKKFLYEKKKKEKELKSKQVKVVVKEIRFGPNTDDHDFEFKLKHSKKFLEQGAKVKAYVQFKGRTIVFKDRGRDLLKRFVAELEGIGFPDYPPKMEDRRMHCTLSPKKMGKSKN
ncbi:translation initiation factor IF-3 [Aureispira anguillae]|uniref:Translation initiation factor IF-3 n=1 Tax=Aureispira anguillae TaxID=2864201 RepID=A0A915YFG3_9BACT|nr:translation initiation factor IF-3 [Aureispira anguillae]BDS12170.1 translation initiation factor IF-3 [Aureispira anguillae]